MDIESGNKIIAEFMGAEWIEDDYGVFGYKSQTFPGFHKMISTQSLKYHSSWDWLMPVCRKFKDLDLNNSNYASLMEDIDTSIVDEYDIKQAFHAVVSAIKWYNSTTIR